MNQQKNISDNTTVETSKVTKMSEKYRATRSLAITWCAGLIGISLIILQDYISMGITDIPIFVSLIAFSLALPLLTGAILLFQIEMQSGYVNSDLKKRSFVNKIFWIGAYGVFIGVDTAIWHLTWIAGTLFLVVSFIAWSGVGYHLPKGDVIQQARREEAEKEQALERSLD